MEDHDRPDDRPDDRLDELPDALDVLDTSDVAAEVVAQLLAAGVRLACAESCTAGAATARLAAVPSSGSVLAGGLVSYHRDVKHRLLGVPDGPVVSRQAAEAMAAGVRSLLDTEVGLAITGVAGPEPQDDRPVGTVHLAVDVGGDVAHREVALGGDPDEVRAGAVEAALVLCHHRLTHALSAADCPFETPVRQR